MTQYPFKLSWIELVVIAVVALASALLMGVFIFTIVMSADSTALDQSQLEWRPIVSSAWCCECGGFRLECVPSYFIRPPLGFFTFALLVFGVYYLLFREGKDDQKQDG